MTSRDVEGQRLLLLVVFGSLGLIGSVLVGMFSDDPALSMVLISACAGISGFASYNLSAVLNTAAVVHFACAVILLSQAIGLCTRGCGTLPYYADLGPLTTTWAGVFGHLVVALLHMFPGKTIWKGRLAAAGSAVLAGGSLFYAAILYREMSWCTSCIMVHALMAGVVVTLWMRLRDSTGRLTVVCGLLAGGGGLNAVYHHQPPYDDRHGWDQMADYVALSVQQGRPYARATVDDLQASMPKPEAQDVLSSSKFQRALDQAIASTDVSRMHGDEGRHRAKITTGNSAVQDIIGSSKRLEEATMDAVGTAFDRWGSPDAPIIVRVAMALDCAGCRDEWPKVRRVLAEPVASGTVAVELALLWQEQPRINIGAKAAAYLVYLAGTLGQDRLVETVDRLFDPDCQEMIEQITNLAQAELVDGKVPPQSMANYMVALLNRLEEMDLRQAATNWDNYGGAIKDRLRVHAGWLTRYGKLATPAIYYLTANDPMHQPYQQSLNLDPMVVSTWIEDGLSATAAGSNH